MFDSNIDQEPLQFEIGAGKVIPGFDDAVTGLAEGEKRKQHVPANKAYGTALALLDVNSHEYLAVVASRVSCILLFHNARQSICHHQLSLNAIGGAVSDHRHSLC